MKKLRLKENSEIPILEMIVQQGTCYVCREEKRVVSKPNNSEGTCGDCSAQISELLEKALS